MNNTPAIASPRPALGAGARIVAAADEERRRLARNLHDGAQQRLVSLALHLRLLATRLNAGSEARQMLEDAQAELAASLTELRELARGLHPAVLSTHGLAAALESLAAIAPLPVELSVAPGRRPAAPLETAAYYFVSEALANIAKHAQAETATVTVATEAGWLVVEVADDGVGGADPGCGSGLRGLDDRVRALGGHFDVSSPSHGGTRLRAELPLREGP